MKPLLPAFLASLLAMLPAAAQDIASPGEMSKDDPTATSSPAPAKSPAPPARPSHGNNAELQASVDRLTRANADLLDLLKRQQAVLEDIQYDRRLQNRQISLVEQRLEDTLAQNASLQSQVSKLKAEQAAGPAEKPDDDTAATAAAALATTPAAAATPATPLAPPASFLPPAPAEVAPGEMGWHRLLSLSGNDTQKSKIFQISGSHWRVRWHNQDKPGDTYKNTSALFINAFPANDSIPKKICSQLGSGGDTTDLKGTGDYYLKVEASGGHWELAVEDYR